MMHVSPNDEGLNGITATTVEKSVIVNVQTISLIKNDAPTDGSGGDLIVNWYGNTTNGNQIVLKPGEYIDNWENVQCSTLYYKSSTGSVPFRFVGFRI